MPTDQKEKILVELLHAILPTILNATLSKASATLLSEAMLQLIMKPRKERVQMDVLGVSKSTALPVERSYARLIKILSHIIQFSARNY